MIHFDLIKTGKGFVCFAIGNDEPKRMPLEEVGMSGRMSASNCKRIVSPFVQIFLGTFKGASVNSMHRKRKPAFRHSIKRPLAKCYQVDVVSLYC